MQMGLIRMHAAIRNQAEKMKLPPAGARVLHRVEQHGMTKEIAALNHQLDARGVHMNDASGPNVQVADFTVSHLPFGQSHRRAAGLNQGIRIFAQQTVVYRLTGKRDRVRFGFGSITPAVEDYKDKRLW